MGDRDLIRRAKQRDEAAWEEIYERHKQGIYRYIYYRVSDVRLAEDLMQEVFLKAVAAVDSFDFRGVSLSAWLYRIARNLVIDHYRCRSEQKELTLNESLAASEEDISATIEKKLARRQLWRALGRLTDLQRDVIILKFIEGKEAIYYVCSTEGDRANIEELKKNFAEFLMDENFASIKFENWYSLFSSLVSHKNFSRKRKIILALDEFPYLILSNPNIPSIFQKIWDNILRKENIMLILCGSYISVMERKVINKRSPLYGRRTASFLLNSLDFVELKKFLPNYSAEDLINSWSVVGGVPAYLQKFDANLDFWENVKNNIAKGSYLYEEAEILLRDEFREPKNYKLILKAISFGYRTLGKICNFTYLDKSMVSKYLDILKEVKIVQERVPVTERKRFKGRLYEIIDPYFNFWFRFVYPNKIDLEAHREDIIIENIKQEFRQYVAEMFEILIENLIRKRYLLDKLSFTKIGKWWHKDKEIDLVALNEKTKEILFSVISHDLKNAFTSLILGTEMLNENSDLDRDEISIIAKELDRNVKNNFNMMQNLLEWARIQMGRIDFKPQRFNLSQSIDEALKILKYKARKKNLSFVTQIDKELNVYADARMIFSVIQNLVGNAIKFSKIGGEISIAALQEKDKIKLTISDNGVGISKENLKNLFKIDKIKSTKGTEGEKGTGFGLILCREFILKNKGTIFVDSILGYGTKVTVYLPV